VGEHREQGDGRRPNICVLITDQERSRDWITAGLEDRIPNRQRLRREGVELTRHYTHSSPCSPSRATILTGQHVPEHGVTDNVFVDPVQPDLHTGTPTLGHLLGGAGYRCSYIGKWHLSYGNPRMQSYGFADWSGDDWAWTGLAGTGTYFDPLIAANAATWLLVVALVNPHDIHWYPADQPWYQDAHREEIDAINRLIAPPIPGEPTVAPFTGDYDELFGLPPNFVDPLDGKPAVHKQWRYEELHSYYGYLDHGDERAWRRGLDYYFRLHELSDAQLGIVLAALDDIDGWDDTVVVFTSDHGDMCGGHGLVNKGPFAYEEIMRVPLYVRMPGNKGVQRGVVCDALSSSVDLAPTICDLAGVHDTASLSGRSLVPLVTGTATAVRDHVLFAQAQAWYRSCVALRFSLRGVFDGRYKYVRYFGVGGGVDSTGQGLPWAPRHTVGPDADAWDQEHELYDLVEDPYELSNLAVDPARWPKVAERFEHLRELERRAFTHTRPLGRGGGSSGEAAMMAVSGAFRGERV